MKHLTCTSVLAAPTQTLPEAKRPTHTPAGLVGNTPVLHIGAPFTTPGRGFWAKIEGHNPGGIKDRTALHMVRAARERGQLLPGARIVESSSGTLGLGLALAGATYGHPVTVVTLSGNRLVATHYGLYNTVSGLGNLVTGVLWDFAARADAFWLTWCSLAATGLACAASVAALERSGRLIARTEAPLAPA